MRRWVRAGCDRRRGRGRRRFDRWLRVEHRDFDVRRSRVEQVLDVPQPDDEPTRPPREELEVPDISRWLTGEPPSLPAAGLIVSQDVSAPLSSFEFGSTDTYWGGEVDGVFLSITGGREGMGGDRMQGLLFVLGYDLETHRNVGAAFVRTSQRAGGAVIQRVEAGLMTVSFTASDETEMIDVTTVTLRSQAELYADQG
jgi:hypothetical protein